MAALSMRGCHSGVTPGKLNPQNSNTLVVLVGVHFREKVLFKVEKTFSKEELRYSLEDPALGVSWLSLDYLLGITRVSLRYH